MRKKIIAIYIMALLGTTNAHAFGLDDLTGNIGGVVDSLTGGSLSNIINNIWKKTDSSTGQIASVCYQPSVKFDRNDTCGFINNLSSLETNICDFAPPIPGMKKKDTKVALSGLKSLCNAQRQKFSNIVSTTANNYAEHLIEESGLSDENTTLPNGKKVKDYLRRWNVNDIIKDKSGTNVARTYFMNKDQKSLKLLMDYDKSIHSNGNSVNAMTTDEIQAPADLESYRDDRQELARTLFNNTKETSATAVSALAKLSISGGANGQKLQGQEAQNKALEIVQNKKEQIEYAKANEIGHALNIHAAKNNSLAIPTQEMVSLLRKDLQHQAIAQIRQQQMEEATIIANISEKWDRRAAIAELMVDKEVIMNEEFDEEAAQQAIDQIASGGGNSGGGSGGNIIGNLPF